MRYNERCSVYDVSSPAKSITKSSIVGRKREEQNSHCSMQPNRIGRSQVVQVQVPVPKL